MRKVKTFLALLVAVCFISSAAFSAELSKRDEIIRAVNYGIQVVETKGKAGFDELKNYRFAGGEGYILVSDYKGIMLFHPVLPQLVGKDMTTIQDSKGKYFHAEMKSKYEKSGSGWTSYWWPNPKTKNIELKCTYYKKATMEGKPVIVEAGLYGISESECR
jgi:signal transduction histidine kinase